MSRRAALLVAFALGVSPMFAATNEFHFGKVKFTPVDSFAYQTETQDPKKPMTIVVLTSFKIDRPAVLAAINTPGAFVTQTGEHGSFVMVRLVAPDKCGVSGFLGPTQQDIDVGERHPAKTTVSTASRVAGECWTAAPEKMFDDTYDFHLSYDVPITVIPKPAQLPSGGGEAGAAFVALVNAIHANNWDAAHAHLRPGELPQERPKTTADMKRYFEGVAMNYPKRGVTVTGGLMKGDRANIDIRGTNYEGKKIKGAVALKKAGGLWQVQETNFLFDE